jgi:hypothetical protein
MAACIQMIDSLYASEAHFNATLSPAIWFDSITSNGREFKLRKDLRVPVKREDGLVVLEIRSIPIVAFGDTLADAVVDFQEQFSVVWDRIAMEDDDRLTLDAQAVKREQLQLVDSIAQSA